MAQFTPEATFMSRSELDGFLERKHTFAPETQTYLEKLNREIPANFIDRTAMYERANQGFDNDIDAEAFGRLWAKEYFDLDTSGFDFKGLTEFVAGKPMDPHAFSKKIAEVMDRTRKKGTEQTDMLQNMTQFEKDALSDEDMRKMLAASPRAATEMYERNMTPEQEAVARRLSILDDPDKAVQALEGFSYDEQQQILGWVNAARPQLDQEDGYLTSVARNAAKSLGFMAGNTLPRQGRRMLQSTAEILDVETNAMMTAYGRGARIVSQSETPMFDSRGAWVSDASREEFRARAEESLYTDELLGEGIRVGHGLTGKGKAALREKARAASETFTDRFPAIYQTENRDIKKLLTEKNTFAALAPKIDKANAKTSYYAAAVTNVVADIMAFKVAHKFGLGIGGYAYSYARMQTDLELELMDGGVNPNQAKMISAGFAMPAAMVEKYASDFFTFTKGTTAALGARLLPKAEMGRPVGLLGKFATKVAPNRIADMQHGVLKAMQEQWPGILSQNLAKVAKERGIASVAEFGQEAFQDAILAASKSFAIEFADAHGLDHGVVWAAWQDSLGDLAITMGLVGAAPGAIDVPAAFLATGPVDLFGTGDMMALAEQERDLPSTPIDERVTIESLGAYSRAETHEEREAILAAAGFQDLVAADELHATALEKHQSTFAQMEQAKAERETAAAQELKENAEDPAVPQHLREEVAPTNQETTAANSFDLEAIEKLHTALNPGGTSRTWQDIDTALDSGELTEETMQTIQETRAAGNEIEAFRTTLTNGKSATVLILDGVVSQEQAVKKLYHEVFHDASDRLKGEVLPEGTFEAIVDAVQDARLRRVVPQWYFDAFASDPNAKERIGEEYAARMLERIATNRGGIGINDRGILTRLRNLVADRIGITALRTKARGRLGLTTRAELTDKALADFLRYVIKQNQNPELIARADARRIQMEKDRLNSPDYSVRPAVKGEFPDIQSESDWLGSNGGVVRSFEEEVDFSVRGYRSLPAPKKMSNRRSPRARQVADEFVAEFGIRPGTDLPVGPIGLDENYSQRIAEVYAALPEISRDEETQASYAALATEVEQQYEFLKSRGAKFTHSEQDGYGSSGEMIADVEQNHHMVVYKGGADHPYLGSSTKDSAGLTANDKFRAVHDYFGHASIGSQFGALGEENAWLEHSKMFSPLARRALTAETRAQNSWVNYGPHMYDADGAWLGDPNNPGYIHPADRPFATQKNAILPEEFSTYGGVDLGVQFSVAPSTDSDAFKKWFGDSKVVDADGTPMVVYHGTDTAFNEFRTKQGFRGRGFGVDVVETQGHFFSESLEDAESYGPNVMPAYLAVQKPLTDPFASPMSSRSSDAERKVFDEALADLKYIVSPMIWGEEGNFWIDIDNGISRQRVDEDGEWLKFIFDGDGLFGEWHFLDNPEVVKRLEERGYDGVKVLEPEDYSGSSWFVTKPTQIKSVNNRGTFDATDPRIDFSVSEDPAARRVHAENMHNLAMDPNQNVGAEGGRETTAFFAQVTEGTKGVAELSQGDIHVLSPGGDAGAFLAQRNKYSSNFDNHIGGSIPGFWDLQGIVGSAIVKTFKGSMVDIGASEGALGKIIAETSDITVDAVDPNFKMEKTAKDTGMPEGFRYFAEAFSEANQEGQVLWTEDPEYVPEGVPKDVRAWKPAHKYDVVHEAMVFQFLNNRRGAHIRRAKELMNDGGTLIVEEKVYTEDWAENEAQKDIFKQQFFTAEELKKKAESTLVGMTENMVANAELEQALLDNFGHVYRFWSSGNFVGYAASDDRGSLQKFADNLQDTRSDFTYLPNGFVETAGNARTERASHYGLDPASLDFSIKDNLREVKGYSRVHKALLPQEAENLKKAAAKKLVDLWRKLPSTEEMAHIALAGKAKRGWYQKSAETLVAVFGHEAPRFSALLAATSPQISVEGNLFNALNMWAAWDSVGRPSSPSLAKLVDMPRVTEVLQNSKGEISDEEALQHIIDSGGTREDFELGRELIDLISGGQPSQLLNAWIGNAFRALNSPTPNGILISGPKVNSFMLNLNGVVNEVTNDAWMANYALINQKLFSGSGIKHDRNDPGKAYGYLAMAARTRQAAERITALTGEQWTAAEVQETIWSWTKTLYEMQDGVDPLTPGVTHAGSRTAREILLAGDLTDARIAATPDFATLFFNDTYQEILNDAGYSEQLRELAETSREDNDAAAATSPYPGTQSEAEAVTSEASLKHQLRAAARLELLKARRARESAKKARKSRSKGRSSRTDFSVAQQRDPRREAAVQLAWVILSRKSVTISRAAADKYLDQHFPELQERAAVLGRARALARSLESRKPELLADIDKAFRAIRDHEVMANTKSQTEDELAKMFVGGVASEQKVQSDQRRAAQQLHNRQGITQKELEEKGLAAKDILRDLDAVEELTKPRMLTENEEDKGLEPEEGEIIGSPEITDEFLRTPTDGRTEIDTFIGKIHAAIENSEATEAEKLVDFRRTLQRVLRNAISQLNYGKARESLFKHTSDLDNLVRMDSLARRAAEIMGHAYQARIKAGRDTILEDIRKILSKWGTKGIPSRMRQDKRKLPAAQLTYLKQALEYFKMSGADYDAALKNHLDGSQFKNLPEGKDASEFTQEQLLDMDALARFGGLKFRGLDEIVAAHQFLTNKLESQLREHQKSIDLKKAQDRTRRNILINAQKDMGAEHRTDTLWNAARDSVSQAFTVEQRFDKLTILGDTDRHEVAARMMRQFSRRIWEKADDARLQITGHMDQFTDALAEIYGTDAETAVEDLLKPRDEYRKFSRSGKAPLSKNQLLQIYATMEQGMYRERFEEGGTPEHRHRVKMYPELLKELSGSDVLLIGWLREFYDKQRAPLSQVNNRITGLPIVAPDPLYMPVKMSSKGGFGETVIVVPIVPPSLTPRVPSLLDLDETQGVLDLFQNRVQSNAQYIHMAELHIEMRGIFADGDLQHAIEQAHGAKFLTDTIDHLNDVFAGATPNNTEYHGLSKMASWYAISKLGFNPRMLLRQATSFVAYAGSRIHTQDTTGDVGKVHGSIDNYRISVIDTMNWQVTGLFSAEGRAAMGEIFDSPQAKQRRAAGTSQILNDVSANLKNPKTLRKLVRRGMLFNRYGDMAGIIFAGQGIYRMIKADLIATGMPEAAAKTAALSQFWQIAEQSQQSGAVVNQSIWQRRGGSTAKILGQFTSTPQQFFAKEALTAMEVFQGKRPKGALAQTILVNHILLPLFYHGVNIAIDRLQGDEVDEEEYELLLASFITGPLSGWFVVGNIVSGIIDMLVQQTQPRGGITPISGAVGDLGTPINAVFGALNGLLRGEGDVSEKFWEAMLDSVEGFLPVAREVRKFTDDE